MQTARPYIVHARLANSQTATLCRPRGEWLGAADRFAAKDESVTCNACQRALWKPAAPKRSKRKLCGPNFSVPARPVRSTRRDRQEAHRARMAERRQWQLALVPGFLAA